MCSLFAGFLCEILSCIFSIMRLLSLTVTMNLLLLLIACGTYLAESSIETFDDITELSGKNFDSYLKEHDTFVMFYAPW